MYEIDTASIRLQNPIKITGDIPTDKAVFYQLAKSRILLNDRESQREFMKRSGKNYETTASYLIETSSSKNGLEKWVEGLQIGVNIEVINNICKRIGIDSNKLLPIIIEHDIYEAWLFAKKGNASALPLGIRHKLARRREYLLAEQQGLSDILYRFDLESNPLNEEECRDAMNYAKKRLSKK